MKKWYKSRLVWSGITKIVGGVFISTASFLSGDTNIQTFMTGVVMAIYGIYDVVTRFDTKLGIEK